MGGRTVPAPKPESLAKTPRWKGFVIPTTLVPHSASQCPDLSYLEFVSKPCSSSTLPVQNSCSLSSCPKSTPAHVFLYLFCQYFQIIPKSLPYATDLSSSVLLSHISTLPLSQAPSCLALYPPNHPFSLNDSIHTHSLPRGHKPCWGPSCSTCANYWLNFCGLCCPSSNLWHPSCVHCHVLTSHPSQPNSCLPRTLHESWSDFCFWQTFSKSEHRLHLPKNLPGSALKKLKISHLQEKDIWKL